MNNEEGNSQPIAHKEISPNQSPVPLDAQPAGTPSGTPAPHSPSTLNQPRVQPWPEPVDGKALLDALVAELCRFIVFPKWAAETIALWILHTFGFHLRDVATYLAIESPERECGKSTLLTVLIGLVDRPLPSANISSSAFYRAIEEFEPTLLIDEADTLLRGREELRGILNAGYTRSTGFVWRVSYDPLPAPDAPLAQPSGPPSLPSNPRVDQSINSPGASSGRLVCFSCWGPKAIASIGRVNDTLASRCIVISMHRKTEGEECARLKKLDPVPFRRKCARFILDHADAIANAEPKIPAGLANRAADIWEPLLALADLAGGDWPDLARQAAVALTARAHERSPIGALLLDILIVFTSNNAERLFSRELVATLNSFPDRPWAELRKGKPITDLWFAQQLRPYGIHPRSIRIGDATAKGYVLDEFSDTFKRYIPRSEIEALKKELAESHDPASSPADPPHPPSPPDKPGPSA